MTQRKSARRSSAAAHPSRSAALSADAERSRSRRRAQIREEQERQESTREQVRRRRAPVNQDIENIPPPGASDITTSSCVDTRIRRESDIDTQVRQEIPARIDQASTLRFVHYIPSGGTLLPGAHRVSAFAANWQYY